MGSVLFKVSDIYTGTLDENDQVVQGLSGAQVRVQNELVPSIEQSLVTDSTGEALFSDVEIEPLSITMPAMKKGDVFNAEFTLTNYGLVRADELQIFMPDDTEHYRYFAIFNSGPGCGGGGGSGDDDDQLGFDFPGPGTGMGIKGPRYKSMDGGKCEDAEIAGLPLCMQCWRDKYYNIKKRINDTID